MVPVGSPVVRFWLAGRPVSVGSVVSTTVTAKLPLTAIPPLSITEHVTLVVPSASTVPAAGMQVGVGSGSSSASVAPRPAQSAVQPPVVFASSPADATVGARVGGGREGVGAGSGRRVVEARRRRSG